jgi:peptidoglycan/LPS O-acetylase OafA/YrhL
LTPITNLTISRNARIDFLRGVAISCVLILHFSLAYGVKNNPFLSIMEPSMLRAIVFNGNFGVTMFFVVSGFLITSNSLTRWKDLQRINARKFYLLRFARIMPCLLLVLAIIVILGSLNVPFFINTDGGHHLPTSYFLISVGSVLTFWHNVLMQSDGYVNYCIDIYWSLSVEEVFYLALPIVCLLLRRTWLIVLVCIIAILIGPIYRSQHIDNEIFFMYGYLACFDAIAFGCLTALLARRVALAPKFRRAMRVIAGVTLGSVYLCGIDRHEIFGFTFIALASAAFLLGAANDDSPGWTTGRLSAGIRWLGQHSYELYLFHIVVLALLRNVMSKEQMSYAMYLPWFVLFMSISTLTAWLIARFVSEPANAAIRQRYFSTR